MAEEKLSKGHNVSQILFNVTQEGGAGGGERGETQSFAFGWWHYCLRATSNLETSVPFNLIPYA